jgi:hypothetical protein
MSRLSSFLLGTVTGAALLYVAMSYHLVRATDGIHFVAKRPARFAEAFVDIRSFSMADWASRPQLAADLVQADKQYLLGDAAAAAIEGKVQQLLPTWPK